MSNITITTRPGEVAARTEAILRRRLKDAKLPNRRPFVFAVGGDGTMLTAIREHWHTHPIFVGISAGHLGFLASVEPDQIDELVTAIEAETFQILEAPLMAAYAGDSSVLGYAFNDISIERAGPRASRFALNVDGSTGSFIGDGVIFATALGSTAYSLAAGGPIIDSRATNIFVVTPNNPHVSHLYSSLQRPHVLQQGRRVTVSLSAEDAAERPTQLILDGVAINSQLTDPISITLSDQSVGLLQLGGDDFHSRLEAKRLGRS